MRRKCFRTRTAVLLLLGSLAAGCDLPRDPEGTLDRIPNHTLRVGVIIDEPWTSGAGVAEPDGVEVELVRRLATKLNSDVEWSVGGDSRLMNDLERFELDLVIGGIVESTAWGERVALTSPYITTAPVDVTKWHLEISKALAEKGIGK